MYVYSNKVIFLCLAACLGALKKTSAPLKVCSRTKLLCSEANKHSYNSMFGIKLNCPERKHEYKITLCHSLTCIGWFNSIGTPRSLLGRSFNHFALLTTGVNTLLNDTFYINYVFSKKKKYCMSLLILQHLILIVWKC